jgi:hypothetical protein
VQLPKETRKNVNIRTAQLVQLLTEIGPDIPEISRRLGQFKESVRYRYKEKILGKQFAVQAAVDHERLGLKRMIVIVDFTDEFRSYAASILAAMGRMCYVTGFEKTLPHGEYVINASVPRERANDWADFIRGLKTLGIFQSIEILEFDIFRNAPMKAEYYNFDTGRWDFDWTNLSTPSFNMANYTLSETARLDEVDLLLLEQLQMDANKSLKEISEVVNINYKKLAWHFTSHVMTKSLIRGYRINWMGTKYDEKSEKPRQRQHRYFIVELVVRSPSELERMTLCQIIGRLPFLWAEAVGRDYWAEFAFPVDNVTEAYQYLEDAIAGVKYKAEILTIDQTASLAFTIAPPLFNQAQRRWVFNQSELVSLFENLIVKIRETRSV